MPPLKPRPPGVKRHDGKLVTDAALVAVLQTVDRAGFELLSSSLITATGRVRANPEEKKAAKALRNAERHLRAHGLAKDADRLASIEERYFPTWNTRMLAGNYLPQVYTALTGKRAAITINGPAVAFIEAALTALGFRIGRAGIVAAMDEYRPMKK